VPGGEQTGLTVGVVDEPAGGAGIDGLVVGVVDADADTGGKGRRRVVAQVEVWWIATTDAAKSMPQQLFAAATTAARAFVFVPPSLPPVSGSHVVVQRELVRGWVQVVRRKLVIAFVVDPRRDQVGREKRLPR